MNNPQKSLYCWIVLAVIIFGTVAFVLNLYNKTIREITDNYATTNNVLASHYILNNSYEEQQ